VEDHAIDRRRHVVIVTNPISGSARRRTLVEELAGRLTARGMTVEMLCDLERIAETVRQRMSQSVLRVVVAAGGDGTIAEVVNRTGRGVPLTVMPLGTENLLAKYLGLKSDPRQLCEVISNATVAPLDAGRANGRIFLIMASAGFDADVVERMHRMRAGHITRWSYARPILDALRHYTFPELRVRYETRNASTGGTQRRETLARWMFSFNLPRYARRIPLAPRAVGNDGLLDLYTFRHGSIASGLWYLGWVLCRRHDRLRDCTTARVRRVHVESDARVPYQLDGDHAGWLPLDIEVLPSRLLLMVPSAWITQPIEDEDAASQTMPQAMPARSVG